MTQLDAKTKLLAIIVYGRSGSYFIQSLLDSHPDLISLPPLYTSQFLNDCNKLDKHISAEKALNFVMNFMDGFMLTDRISKTCRQMPMFEEININPEAEFTLEDFRRQFVAAFEQLRILVSDVKLLVFKSMCIAYDSSLRKCPLEESAERTIMFQLHRDDQALMLWLAEHFMEVKIIHMIRAPLIGFASTVRHFDNLSRRNLTKIDQQIMLNQYRYLFFTGCKAIAPAIDHFAIRLEDLHAEPENTLEKLVKRLNIPWHECLLQSTFAGREWTNSKGKENLSMFNPQVVKEFTRINDVIPPKDATILGSLIRHKYDAWNYQYDFEPSENATALTKTHYLLTEYRAYFSGIADALPAYKLQVPIIRSAEMSFILGYAKYHSAPIVEAL